MIMDYEKKYKALVEAVKTLKETNPSNEGIQNWVNDNVPELKEDSEDERIRKTLIHIVKGACSKYSIKYRVDIEEEKLLAWLEKQGEKTEPIEGFNTEFERQISHFIASIANREYEYTEGFVKWVSNSLLNYAKHELEKQGEQNEKMKKDIAEFIFNSREDIKHRYDWIKYLGYDIHFIDKERQCEQKPNPVFDIEIPLGAKDSELQEVSYHIPEGFHAEIKGNEVIIKKGEQKPATWSEEDYNEIETIACHLDNIDNEGMAEVLRNIRDKYYHIIPQTQWKPSEEQIKALDIAIRCGIQLGTWEENALKSLKEQLKKLKGNKDVVLK